MRPIRRLAHIAAAVVATCALASCAMPFMSDGGCLEVQGTFDARAPGYLVLFHEGVPVQATTKELADKYDFTPTSVWESAVQGFAAQLSEAAVAGIRCEPAVKLIEHNAVISLG
jgi:hypothetical protein